MIKSTILGFICMLPFIGNVQTLQKSWSNLYGGTSNEEFEWTASNPFRINYQTSMTKGHDQNIWIASQTSSNDIDVNNNHGSVDAWLLILDENGNIVAEKTFGGTGFDRFVSIEKLHNGNYIVLGGTNSTDGDLATTTSSGLLDVWVVELDPGLNIVWQTRFGTSNHDFSNNIRVLSDDSFILNGFTWSNSAGFANTSVNNSSVGGSANSFIAKYQAHTLVYRNFVSTDYADLMNSEILIENDSICYMGAMTNRSTGAYAGIPWVSPANYRAVLLKVNMNIGKVINKLGLPYDGGANIESIRDIVFNQDSSRIYLLKTVRYTSGSNAFPKGSTLIELSHNNITNILYDTLLTGNGVDFNIRIHPYCNNFIYTAGSSSTNHGYTNYGYEDYRCFVTNSIGTVWGDINVGGTSDDDVSDSYFDEQNNVLYIMGRSYSNDIDFTGSKGEYDLGITKINILPEIICKDTTYVYIDSNGTYDVNPYDLIHSATQFCRFDSIVTSDSVLTCSESKLVQIIAYEKGFSDTCYNWVIPVDTISPTIICKDTTVYLNTTGTITIDTSFVLDSLSDNCTLDSVWLSSMTYSCIDTGLHQVTIYARDNSGNIDSCTANVIVIDTLPPTILCKDTTIYIDLNGTSISIDTSFILDSLSDNCLIDSIWLSSTNYSCLDTGLHQITINVVDVSGNTTSCTANITIFDTITPTILCQDTTVYLGVSGTITIDTSFVLNSVSDNCTLDSVWMLTTTYSCVDTGVNQVTIYAVDINGNIDSCMANITVLDTITPTIVSCLNDTTVQTSGSCNYTIVDFTTNSNFVVSDNCSTQGVDLIVTQSPSAGTVVTSNTTVWLYATDGSGNTDSCSFVVTLNDTIPPVIVSCLADTILPLSASCDVVLPDFTSSSNFVVTDNCATQGGDLTVSQSPTAGTVITANTIIWMYATDGNGNMDSCSFNVTVVDVTAPVITSCISDQSIETDKYCNITIEDYTNHTELIYSDNCSSQGIDLIVTQSIPAGTVIDTDTILWIYITDASGNRDSCSFNISLTNCGIIIYESFAPNGNGQNEYFYIENLDAFPNTSVIIYNRWGTEVFQSDDYQNDWDGRSQSKYNIAGDELPEGTYYYLLTLGGDQANPNYGKVYKGYVYLKK